MRTRRAANRPGIRSNAFVIAAHNLDGFITSGLLNFDSLLDGLMRFLDWGETCWASTFWISSCPSWHNASRGVRFLLR